MEAKIGEGRLGPLGTLTELKPTERISRKLAGRLKRIGDMIYAIHCVNILRAECNAAACSMKLGEGSESGTAKQNRRSSLLVLSSTNELAIWAEAMKLGRVCLESAISSRTELAEAEAKRVRRLS